MTTQYTMLSSRIFEDVIKSYIDIKRKALQQTTLHDYIKVVARDSKIPSFQMYENITQNSIDMHTDEDSGEIFVGLTMYRYLYDVDLVDFSERISYMKYRNIIV